MVLVLVLVVVIGPSPAQPPTPNAQRPKVILILCEGLTLEDLRNPRIPVLFKLADQWSIGLMSVPVNAPKTDTAAMLVLASGMLAPADPVDEEAYMAGEMHPEGDTAERVYARRTGAAASNHDAVHLGIASLTRRDLHDKLLASSAPGAVIAVAGNADTKQPRRPAALFGTDSQGLIKRALIARNRPRLADSPAALAQWTFDRADSDLVVLHLGDLSRAETERPVATDPTFQLARMEALSRLGLLLDLLEERAAKRRESPRVLLVSPRPPLASKGGWNRLAIALMGTMGGHGNQSLISSATTRTSGLISNLDVAPTLLSWLGAPQPAHMTGHPISAAMGSFTDLQRIDGLTRANAEGIVPIFVAMGFVAAVTGFGGLLAVARGKSSRWAAPVMLALSNFPLAMLLVVLLHPRSVISLGAATGLLMVGLAAIEYACGVLLSRRLREISITAGALLALAALTVFTILADALAGQYLIKFSLFSSYQVAGIRFYGIGNEYMGVLVGMALLLVFLGRISRLRAALLFGLTTAILGHPSFGADAGGLVAAVIAFGSGMLLLHARRATWQAAALLSLAGFALAFGIAFLERSLSGPESSHLGGAIQSASSQGWSALFEIIKRKARMNLSILLNPYTLTAIAGAGVVTYLIGGPLRKRLNEITARYPGWRMGLPAAGWGALAAFAFNDSGAVPAIFILGAFLSSGMILLFAGRYPEVASDS